MKDWRPICEVCETKPQQDDDELCIECRASVEVQSSVVTDPLEILLSQHQRVDLPDGRAFCLCHANGNHAVFDGPAYHRRHLAALIYDLFGMPGPKPHVPLLIHEAEQAE